MRGASPTVQAIEQSAGTLMTPPEIDMTGRTLVVRAASDPTVAPVARVERSRLWTPGVFTLADIGSLL